jgi:hypothetical protein
MRESMKADLSDVAGDTLDITEINGIPLDAFDYIEFIPGFTPINPKSGKASRFRLQSNRFTLVGHGK